MKVFSSVLLNKKGRDVDQMEPERIDDAKNAVPFNMPRPAVGKLNNTVITLIE